jgi:hypothetical protein
MRYFRSEAIVDRDLNAKHRWKNIDGAKPLGKPKDATAYYGDIAKRLVEGPGADERVHLGRFGILGAVCHFGEFLGGFHVSVTLHLVADAHTNEARPQSVTVSETVNGMDATVENVRRTARAIILEALEHEVDEWLTVDGHRDPPSHD